MDHETITSQKKINKPGKTEKIPDSWGNYDIDGVSQTSDFDVVVASDKIGPHKPPQMATMKAIKLSFKRWVDKWKDEEA